MYLDYYYLILVVPTLLLSIWAQFLVKSTFAKYSRVPCSRGLTGRDAAALTYLASALTALMSFLRLILISKDRRRR